MDAIPNFRLLAIARAVDAKHFTANPHDIKDPTGLWYAYECGRLKSVVESVRALLPEPDTECVCYHARHDHIDVDGHCTAIDTCECDEYRANEPDFDAELAQRCAI
jgi:hypothetical protein